MAPTLPQVNSLRLRSYAYRLPLFTRIVLLAIFVLWIARFPLKWDVVRWGGLIPNEMNLGTSAFDAMKVFRSAAE